MSRGWAAHGFSLPGVARSVSTCAERSSVGFLQSMENDLLTIACFFFMHHNFFIALSDHFSSLASRGCGIEFKIYLTFNTTI